MSVAPASIHHNQELLGLCALADDQRNFGLMNTTWKHLAMLLSSSAPRLPQHSPVFGLVRRTLQHLLLQFSHLVGDIEVAARGLQQQVLCFASPPSFPRIPPSELIDHDHEICNSET